MSALLDLVRQLPDEDLARAARALEDEALASIIRELPTDALIRLVTGDVIDRDAKPAKVSKPRRATIKAPARKARKSAPERESKGHEARSAAARERDDGIVAWLEKHGTSSGPQVAKALGFNAVTLQGYLRRLVAEGRIERSGGKSGPGVRYSPVGRQKSARKTSKPVRGSDEEEGEGVPNLAIVSSRVMPAPRAIPAPPPSERRALPVLQVGQGDRQTECRHYDGCLDRFVALHDRGRRPRGRPKAAHAGEHARCPANCDAFELVPSHVRLAIAATYGERPNAPAL